MKKLFYNAINSLFSTIAGAVAGGEVILEGAQEKNPLKVIAGVFIVLLGAISNENGSSKPYQ